MGKLKNKGAIITISVLIATLVFSALSLLIISLLSKDSKKTPNGPIDAIVTAENVDYSFGAYGLYVGGSVSNAPTKAQYESWQTVGIENAYGLMAFSHSVANGYSFSGKTVYLLADIEGDDITHNAELGNFVPIGAKMWNGSSPTNKYNGKNPFLGTFDGQGFTVSNLVTAINDRAGDSGDLHLGFFAQIKQNAKVQNLKIDNFEISSYNHNDEVFSLVGGIAGYVNLSGFEGYNTIIENCVVKNLYVNIADKQADVGGLVGYSKIYQKCTLNLSECAVVNFEINSSVNFNNAGGLIAKTYSYTGNDGHLSYFYHGVTSINNCYVENFSISESVAERIANISPACGYVYAVHAWVATPKDVKEFDNNYFIYEIYNCVVKSDNAYDNVKDTKTIDRDYVEPPCLYENIIDSNVKNNPTTFESALGKLDDPQLIGKIGKTSTTWYYNAEYNNGLPKLRIAIDWFEIPIEVEGNGSVTESSILIPSEYIPNFHTYKVTDDNDPLTTNGNLLTIYGQGVTASPTPNTTVANHSCYYFVDWVIEYKTIKIPIPSIIPGETDKYLEFTTDVTIKAKFSPNTNCELKFDSNDNADVTDTNKYGPFIDGEGKRKYACGGYGVDVIFTQIRSGVYKEVNVVFYNTEGVSVGCITYTPKSGYYIKSLKIKEQEFTNNTSLTLHDDVTFSVQTEIKQYGIEIG